MHLFTTEDAEDTEVNLVHAGTEMNEMTCILGIFVQYKQVIWHPGLISADTRVSAYVPGAQLNHRINYLKIFVYFRDN